MNKTLLFLLTLLLLFWSCGSPTPDISGDSGDTKAATTADTDAPVITIVNPVNNSAVSLSLIFSGIAEDASDISQIQIQIDNNGWVTLPTPGVYWSYTVNTFTLDEAENPHTASVKATDAKGNTSGISSVNFNVDKTVPDIVITSPSHGDNVKGAITIEGTASDSSGISEVLINPDEGPIYFDTGDTTNWNYDFDSTTVTDGTLIISVLATDTASLYTIENFAVVVDNTPPALNITSHSDQETINSDFTLSGTAADSLGLDRIEVKVDSNPNGTATGTTNWSYNISGLTEEAHTIQVIAYDITGNFTNKSITIYYDTTPPEITINNPVTGSYQKGSSITINGTVSNLVPGTDVLEISINGLAYTDITNYSFLDPDYSWTYSYDSTGSTGQPIGVSIRATDITTNAVDIVTRDFYIDNQAPTGSIESPSQGASVTDTGTVQITGTAQDNMALDTITIDIVDNTTASSVSGAAPILAGNQWSYNWATTGFAGTSTITVTITDKAANQVVLTPVNVTMDNTAPQAELLAPTNGQIVAGTTNIRVSALASGGNSIDSVMVQIDSETSVAATDPDLDDIYVYAYDTTGLSEGLHDLYITVTDSPGGSTTSIHTKFTVDNTDPVVSITYPTSANVDESFLYSQIDVAGTASDIHLDTVTIEIDSQGPVAVTGTSSWTYIWDTVAYPGAQDDTLIRVTATDSVGNTGTASVVVDVRPKIDSLSLSSGLRGESLEIYGYNFNDALPNFNVVFTAGAGTINGTTPVVGVLGPTGESVSVNIPATATSGDVYVEEGSTIIASNAMNLDVWDNTSLSTANEISMVVTDTDVYAAFRNDKAMDFYDGTAHIVDATAQSTGGGISITLNTSDNNTIYGVYTNKNKGPVIPKLAAITLSTYAASVYSITIGGATIDTLSPTARMSIDFYKGSLPLDPVDDVIGMVYYDTNLKYTYTDAATPSSWEAAITIDGTVGNGEYSKMIFDSTGIPYVAYYDSTNQILKFAYLSGGAFVSRTVDASPYVGDFNSMTLDISDGIHISYYDGNDGDLRYAYASGKDTGFVVSEGIATSGITGQYSDIAVDSSGHPHIGFLNYNLSTVQYVFFDGTDWQNISTPDSLNTAQLTRLSVEPRGDDIFIGYVDSGSTANYLVYYP